MNEPLRIVIWVLYFVVISVYLIALWKIFTKASQSGWLSLIPFVNIYILIKIAGKPGWWIVLTLIPFVNTIFFILIFIKLAEKFGESTIFGLGLAFFGIICFPILAFGDAKYTE